jgi:hypothetical protein
MSSVYRDTAGAVTFTHPIGTALTATFIDSTGTVVDTQAGLTPVAGIYTAQVKWQLTQYDAKYTVVWTGANNFSRTTTFEVVTPLVPLSTLKTIYTGTGITVEDPELAELEKTVRVVIERYTGQSFGWSVGSRTYVGTGTGKLILSERCNKLNGILGGWSMYPATFVAAITNANGELNLDRAALIQDGWTCLIQWPEFLNVKETPPMELVQFSPAQDGTIRVPRRYMKERDYGTQYVLNAEWGYDAVPDEVQEAAMLLANDYASHEVGYRDRYLQILKIQQDSLTYHNAAFRGTGNARVDLLLGGFRRQNGMIVL